MPFRFLPNGCSWYETHKLGGCQRHLQPRAECAPPHLPSITMQHHLAVIVPYRSTDGRVRADDFANLCDRLGSHLASNDVSYQIFIVNQADELPFNRGALSNAAVALLMASSLSSVPSSTNRQAALRLRKQRHAFDYIAVHDVDRFPVEDASFTGAMLSSNRSDDCENATRSYYTYPFTAPRVLHPMSFAGGVLVATLAQYIAVNGFSNTYWGWGEEDNDLFLRLRWCGFAPIHGERLDECMEHKDCEACKRQKHPRHADALLTNEQKMRLRMMNPRPYMLRDGLTTANFTILPTSGRRLLCGRIRRVKATVMDVDLARGIRAQAGQSPAPPR